MTSLSAPREFLQLAGHPLRWTLLNALAASDRVVSELTELVGEPQNLVSYHLGKLRDAGIVFSRRSAADRRDSYYGIDLARFGSMLTEAGAALHPGLRLTQPSTTAPLQAARVLFLCTGNSARSQMAEAFLKARGGGMVEAFSAGSEPKSVHPNAIRVMRAEYSLDLSAHTSKHLSIFASHRFDRVISLCDRVREICPDFAGDPDAIHWSIPNPVTAELDDVTYSNFQKVAAELSTRVDFLIAALADDTHRA